MDWELVKVILSWPRLNADRIAACLTFRTEGGVTVFFSKSEFNLKTFFYPTAAARLLVIS